MEFHRISTINGWFFVANEVDEVTFVTLSEYMIEKLQPGMTIGLLAKLVAKQTNMKAQQVSQSLNALRGASTSI